MDKRWYEVTLTDSKQVFPLGRHYALTETDAIAKAKTKFRGTINRLELPSWIYTAVQVDGAKPKRTVAEKPEQRSLYGAR